jgi:ABC-2 type transport system permease protein
MNFVRPHSSRRYTWLIILAGLILLNWAGSLRHFRVDLTEDKRYSLSAPTEHLLKELDSTVFIDVYLKGDFPAVFRNLQNTTRDLLREMQDDSRGRLQFQFVKPGEGLPDSLQAEVYDSLKAMGLSPYNLEVSSKPGEESSQRLIFPSAVVRYGGKALPIDLLSGAKNADPDASMNNAESLLEFKLADAISRLTRRAVPKVAYLLGNGEPLNIHSYDAISTLVKNYVLDTVTLWRVPFIPDAYSSVVIAKPLQAFSDADKLKIDQYIMYGGKVIWFIDALYAEMDSLEQTNQFVAYDRGLNLEDQLFRYGVRINQDLIEDMQQCDQVPLAVGSAGGKPQMQLVPWPYFPLLTPSDDHPLSRNLDLVLGTFVNSIDTVKAAGIRKTILLTSSNQSRRLGTPAIVSWESVKQAPDAAQYNQKQIPAGVLLEGPFHSLYENRLPALMRDSLERIGHPYLSMAKASTRMIVVSDGDFILNAFTQKDGPLQMGTNQYTQDQYANKDFFLNCMEYLTNPEGIIESRNKQLVLRSLDKQRVEDERLQWQMINIALPILLVVLAGVIYQQIRKKKYQK